MTLQGSSLVGAIRFLASPFRDCIRLMKNALNMMVGKRLMFREGERFLSLAVPTRGFGEKSKIRIYVFFLLISSAMVLISRRLVCMALHPYQSV